MRHSKNIFENESYRGAGVKRVSAVTVVTLVLSVISAAAGICIIVNFREITAKIAVGAAKLLSSGFPILLALAAVIYLIMRLKWRLRGRLWRR